MARWKYELFACGCDKTCSFLLFQKRIEDWLMIGLLGSFLPCVAYGRTQQRLQDEDDEMANCSLPVCSLLRRWNQGTDRSQCCTWCILAPCSLSILLQCFQRRQIKNRKGIEQNCCFDLTTSCCCGPCGLIQEYKEVRDLSQVEMSQPQRPAPMTRRRE